MLKLKTTLMTLAVAALSMPALADTGHLPITTDEARNAGYGYETKNDAVAAEAPMDETHIDPSEIEPAAGVEDTDSPPYEPPPSVVQKERPLPITTDDARKAPY